MSDHLCQILTSKEQKNLSISNINLCENEFVLPTPSKKANKTKKNGNFLKNAAKIVN